MPNSIRPQTLQNGLLICKYELHRRIGGSNWVLNISLNIILTFFSQPTLKRLENTSLVYTRTYTFNITYCPLNPTIVLKNCQIKASLTRTYLVIKTLTMISYDWTLISMNSNKLCICSLVVVTYQISNKSWIFKIKVIWIPMD